MSGYEMLLVRLDQNRVKADRDFLELRRKLIKIFECRRCFDPSACADDAISRVARRLTEGEEIANIKSYLVGVAKLIALEEHRSRRTSNIDDLETGIELADPANQETELIERTLEERRMGCLRRCLDELPPESRDLALSYYESDKDQKIAGRKDLAKRLGISEETLRKRAQRLRKNLESCVTKCLNPSLGNER
jgi:RNA polymerase sigma factor (sigma-70 family)